MSHSLFNTAEIVRTLMLSGLIGVIGISSVQAQTPAAADSVVTPQVPQPAAQPPTPAASGDAFIDRTDYSLGATERIEAPAVIAQPTKRSRDQHSADSEPLALQFAQSHRNQSIDEC